MLYYCSRMCRSIIFPPFFDSLNWGMLIYFLSWNLLDVIHSYLTCCVDCICCFRFSRFGHSYLRQWLARCVSECYALERIAPILLKVLTLNVAICIICLHFSSFCCLSSVADFSNTEVRALTSTGRALFLPARRAMRFMYVVWVWVMVIFRWLFLFSSIEATLIDEQQ